MPTGDEEHAGRDRFYSAWVVWLRRLDIFLSLCRSALRYWCLAMIWNNGRYLTATAFMNSIGQWGKKTKQTAKKLACWMFTREYARTKKMRSDLSIFAGIDSVELVNDRCEARGRYPCGRSRRHWSVFLHPSDFLLLFCQKMTREINRKQIANKLFLKRCWVNFYFKGTSEMSWKEGLFAADFDAQAVGRVSLDWG